jgi:hypothetical protein
VTSEILDEMRAGQEAWQQAGYERIVDFESAHEVLPALNRQWDAATQRVDEITPRALLENPGEARRLRKSHDERSKTGFPNRMRRSAV